MSKIIGFSGKSIGKGAFSVGKGAAGILAGHFVANNCHKIPVIGPHCEDKPLLREALPAVIGVLLMGSDTLYDAGLCMAANAVSRAAMNFDMVRMRVGHPDPVLSESMAKMEAEKIMAGIAEGIAAYKSGNTELSENPHLSYVGV